MTNHLPGAVVSRYFESLDRGDLPSALALLGADAAWYQPGSNRFSGVHIGYIAVASLFAGMMEVSEGTLRITLADVPMVNGDLVACRVRFGAQRADASIEMSGVDLFTVEGGKIAAIHLFSDDNAAEDRFWGTY
jgi:ketosteroid isomerase-like protein